MAAVSNVECSGPPLPPDCSAIPVTHVIRVNRVGDRYVTVNILGHGCKDRCA